MGSTAIGAWIAHLVFWALLVRGYIYDDLGVRGCAIAIALWLAGYLALPYLPYSPPFASYIAVLDIALVFVIFKGDVRLT